MLRGEGGVAGAIPATENGRLSPLSRAKACQLCSHERLAGHRGRDLLSGTLSWRRAKRWREAGGAAAQDRTVDLHIIKHSNHPKGFKALPQL